MNNQDIEGKIQLLFPMPQQLRICDKELHIDTKENIRIFISSKEIMSHGIMIQKRLLEQDIHSQIYNDSKYNRSADSLDIQLLINNQDFDKGESYKLMINRNSVEIIGADHAGLFYGVLTFYQIIKIFYSQESIIIPCLEIEDFPDFP
ncbi:MAG: glycoside hydrolase family 20 zincin-like fold domain-containing protein, partial [Candidatus Kariarchaeaceae archaeon]